MGGDDALTRRSSYFSGCISPACVPMHEEYSRIHVTGKTHSSRNRRLRMLIRKIVTGSKNTYHSAKPITFQYDAVSYSHNFDDGCGGQMNVVAVRKCERVLDGGNTL